MMISKTNSLEVTGNFESYQSAVTDKTISGEFALTTDKKITFQRAPETFFGKTLAINISGRTEEEKEINRSVLLHFNKSINEYFGKEIAAYLYPEDDQKKLLELGAPLTAEKARSVIEKGLRMTVAIAQYCEQYRDAESPEITGAHSSLHQTLGVARFAEEEKKATASLHEEKGNPDDHLENVLAHSLGVAGGGVLAGFAVMATGSLSPSDIFFLMDLMSSKYLSKSIEDFVVKMLLLRLEQYESKGVVTRAQTNMALSKLNRSVVDNYGRSYLSSFLTSVTIRAASAELSDHTNHDPEHIAAAALGMGSGIDHMGIGAGHSRLFKMGVESVLENFKKLQDSLSNWSQATEAQEDFLKAQASATAAQQRAMKAAQEAGDQKNFALAKEAVAKAIAPTAAVPKATRIPPWRRGI